MQIKFCGAAREVTGSSHLITLKNGYTILLDCGLYQGNSPAWENFNNEWKFDPKTLNCLIVSHAHIDHTGRVPKLYKDGFRGDIFATNATRSLCAIMLMDSARIQEMDASFAKKKNLDEAKSEALYSEEDVKGVMEHFTGMPYERWQNITDGVRLMFRDTGHILGSASITLEIEEDGKKTLLGFTGDIGRPARPILGDPIPMPEVDYLIAESTYGDREHATAPSELEQFLSIIEETCVNDKGKLLIPAFSVGRTQEVVYMLDQLFNAGKLPKIPVYVDSPLAIDATRIFEQHPECFDKALVNYMLTDPNPFGFADLHYTRTVEDSKKINDMEGPAIIIASSGMMNAGRIRHHLANSLESPKNAVLIVGYCAPNTPGGMLRQGVDKLKLFGKELSVNLKVHTMDSFSAHGDRNEMYEFMKNQKSLKKLFLVHGDYDTQQAYKAFLSEKGFCGDDIVIPTLGDVFEC